MTYYTVILILLIASVARTLCVRFDPSIYRYQRKATSQNAPWNSTLNTEKGTDVTKDKVNLTVYYETRCGASIEFIVLELKPALEKLGPHLDVHLVPYGFAKVQEVLGRYSFDCHHGQAECNGNMMHACTLDVVKNQTKAILFNACLLQYPTRSGKHVNDLIPVLNWCGHKQRVSIRPIWDCMNNNRGPTLLKEYGEQTDSGNPEYVPYLVLDGKHSEEAYYNGLLRTVCKMLQPTPSVCNDEEYI